MGVVLLLGSACSSTSSSPTPSAAVTTAQPVWPRYFTLEWSAEPEAAGGQRIAGYVYNTDGFAADRVQILAQALDASGSVIGQRLEWLSSVIPADGRAFFRVDHLPRASAYRVSVRRLGVDERRRAEHPAVPARHRDLTPG
jgi:hypothetical protein